MYLEVDLYIGFPRSVKPFYLATTNAPGAQQAEAAFGGAERNVIVFMDDSHSSAWMPASPIVGCTQTVTTKRANAR